MTEPTPRPRLGFGWVLLLIVLGAFALRVAYVLTVTQLDHLYDESSTSSRRAAWPMGTAS